MIEIWAQKPPCAFGENRRSQGQRPVPRVRFDEPAIWCDGWKYQYGDAVLKASGEITPVAESAAAAAADAAAADAASGVRQWGPITHPSGWFPLASFVQRGVSFRGRQLATQSISQ